MRTTHVFEYEFYNAGTFETHKFEDHKYKTFGEKNKGNGFNMK